MKNFKKVTAIIMGATLIMSSSAMVIAYNNKSAQAETSISVEDNITSEAIIKAIEKDEDGTRVLITPIDEDSMDIMLNVFEDTKIDLDSLKEGDTVIATYSKAMTRSIPPQSSAIEIKKEETSNDVETQSNDLALVNLSTTIKEISDEDKSILVGDSDDINSQISLNINDETIIMNTDGIPLNFSELKSGDKINVVHSPAMTFSIPPQTYAYAIILNNEQVAAPQYIEVENVTTENDTTIVESKDGNYIIRVTKDTQVVPFKTRNIVTAQDIVKGSSLFAWYDLLTASIPAQATATKVMILPQKEIEEAKSIEFIDEVYKISMSNLSTLDKIIVNDEQLDLSNKEIKSINDSVMLPLRAISEKLGFNVEWDEETNSVQLNKDGINANLIEGSQTYIIQQETKSTNVAPTNINGYLYVPAEFFDELAQLNIFEDGMLHIN